MTQCFNVCPRFLPLFFQQRMCVMLVQPAVCGIYDLPPLSSFFLFLFSSIEKRKSFLPRNGVFFSPLGRGGNVCAPHFFFSRERKRNVPRPVQRKRALGAAFVTKAAPFSFVLYVLATSILVLCGLVSPFAPLPLTGADGLTYALEPVAFVANAASFSFVSMS